MNSRVTELDKLEEIARIATCGALRDYKIPNEWKENLILGSFWDEHVRTFELYLTGELPEDAIVISTAKVDRKTKAVTVSISNLEKRKT